MTAPRQILPGSTYFITRRCTQRLFLLRPDPATNAIYLYCLADAARRSEVEVVAFDLMPNHYHAVVQDPLGRLPAFLEHFHKLVAKVMNARLGRWENFWSSEETCATRLDTDADVLDKVIYVLANPVAANLVDRLVDWPGANSLEYLDGNSRRHLRPEWFFNPDGKTLPSVELRVVQPRFSVAVGETFQDWVQRVRAALAERERTLREERERSQRSVLGAERVLARSFYDAPATTESRRNLRPRFAAKNRETRKALLASWRIFLDLYRTAQGRFQLGQRDVAFPLGSYRMCSLGARRVEPALAA